MEDTAGSLGTLPRRIERRNATFQHWQTLLTNRAKRNRAGEFLVQGVRPISMAAAGGHRFHALLRSGEDTPSRWAGELMESGLAPVVTLAPDLLAELAQRDEQVPELLAVVEMPPDDPARIPAVDNPLVVVFDRPGNPGNIGSLARSVDALGGTALIVTGHAADVYDPQAVRASTGSLFRVPVVRLPSHAEVMAWVTERRAAGVDLRVVGTDETGTVAVDEAPLATPSVVVVGNETAGMTRAWRSCCDVIASIPMTGSASSLNAANAGSIVLYEASRQRRTALSE
jgi:tRNA G18 (ribose-2'-O)-methylase SpoU